MGDEEEEGVGGSCFFFFSKGVKERSCLVVSFRVKILEGPQVFGPIICPPIGCLGKPVTV